MAKGGKRVNKVILIGRLAKDPEVRYTDGMDPLCIARYTIAVDRKIKKQGEAAADFIRCICFGKTGEFVESYLKKGIKVAITGRVQTGSYTNKDGKKVYTTDIVVEEHEFCESKGNQARQEAQMEQKESVVDENGFMNIPDGIDEDLPFN